MLDDSRPPPTCVSCAACCFSRLDTYVRVTGDDYERLGVAAESMAHFDGHRAFMRMVDGHCKALQIAPGADTFACTVYERRPQACRDLERGTPQCLGELGSKGDRPRHALRLARAASSGDT